MPIFSKCKDPALTALKNAGYNVVQTPRPNLMPTQLLASSGSRLRYLGELTSVFFPVEGGAPVPLLGPEQPGPNISGTKSSDVKIGFGLDILSGLISALGGGTLGITSAYSKAASVQFTYSDTIRIDSQFAELDAYIASAEINPHARAVRDMLKHDEVYVITAVAKSKKINVAAKSKEGTEFKIDLPVIQNTIGGNVSVTAVGESSGVLTYEGAIPLTFGFQATRLIFDGSIYRTAKAADAGSVVAERTGASGNEPDLLDHEFMLEGDL